jgi:hypothetical protein
MALPLVLTFDISEAIRKSPTTTSLATVYSTAAVTLLATAGPTATAVYSAFAVLSGYLIVKARLNSLHYLRPTAPELNSATNKITEAFCCSCCVAYGRIFRPGSC